MKYCAFLLSAFLLQVTSALQINCPDAGRHLIAHPTECSQFIQCNNGVATIVDCYPGLKFDRTTGFCDLPQNVNCKVEDPEMKDPEINDPEIKDPEIKDPEIKDPEIKDPEIKDPEIKDPEIKDPEIELPELDKPEMDKPEINDPDSDDPQADGPETGCSSTGQYFLPHPTICRQFIECNNGATSVHVCFNDFYWNPEIGMCDFPGNVDCVDRVPEPETGKPGPVGQCPEQGEFVDFLPDGADCGTYYMCSWGTPIQMSCPYGLHFNPTVDVCDYPWDAGCAAA